MADEIVQRVSIYWQGSSQLSSDLARGAESAKRINDFLKQSASRPYHGPSAGPFGFQAPTSAGPFGAGGYNPNLGAGKPPIVPYNAPIHDPFSGGNENYQHSWIHERRYGSGKFNLGENPSASNAAADVIGGVQSEARNKLAAQLSIISSLQRQKEQEEISRMQRRYDLQFRYEDKLERQIKERASLRQSHENAQRATESRHSLMAGIAGGAGLAFGMHAAGLANPFAMQRFGQAANDFQAVIGRTFVPALKRATDFVRSAADTYNDMPETAKSGIAGVAEGAVAGLLVRSAISRTTGLAAAGSKFAELGKYATKGGLVTAGAVALDEVTEGAVGNFLGDAFRGARAIGRSLNPFTSKEEDAKADAIAKINSRTNWGLMNKDMAAMEKIRQNAGPSDEAFVKSTGFFRPGGSSFGASGVEASYTDPISMITKLRSDAFKFASMGSGQSAEERTAVATEKIVDLLGSSPDGPTGPLGKYLGPYADRKQIPQETRDIYTTQGNTPKAGTPTE